jgi:SAM-dependent methyltransferase
VAELSPARFHRYLAAKKSIDDRSLNGRVWDVLRGSLASSPRVGAVSILEVGCGIGTMVERIIDWNLLPLGLYTGVEASSEALAEARTRFQHWGSGLGRELIEDTEGGMTLRTRSCSLKVEMLPQDLFDYLGEGAVVGPWDLLMAHAVLDLVDLSQAVPLLLSRVRPGGCVYFTLNFDGQTVFEPTEDKALDETIERLYHETMDGRLVRGRPTGGSRTGRSLLRSLRALGACLLAAGGSDWICVAGPEGYGEDEAFFLHFIVDTVGEALSGHPQLDPRRFSDWLNLRHRQIDSHELIYLAHQIDLVARVDGPASGSRTAAVE